MTPVKFVCYKSVGEVLVRLNRRKNLSFQLSLGVNLITGGIVVKLKVFDDSVLKEKKEGDERVGGSTENKMFVTLTIKRNERSIFLTKRVYKNVFFSSPLSTENLNRVELIKIRMSRRNSDILSYLKV